jgi:hypothetical protein
LIPDCYDPVCQEEQRQKEWDEFAEGLPTCHLCRRRLYPGMRYHVANFFVVCSYCKEELDENEETVELDD